MTDYEKAERLVRNEVFVCLSHLVSTLASQWVETGPLSDLTEQAAELAAPVMDYEEATYEWEVYEHWAVDQSLAEDLASVGEKVDMDFAGMCVWARTTTGQGISGDSCIRKVLELRQRRYDEVIGR